MRRISTILFSSATITISLILAFIYAGSHTGLITMDDYIQFKIEQKKLNKPKSGYPDEAMKWYIEQRKSATGQIPENWRAEAMEHIARYNMKPDAIEGVNALAWSELGPNNIGGRVRSVLVHPTDPNIIYAAAVSGGVWKTTNGGTSWVPLKDLMENLAICAMAWDPANPNTIYAGSGEGFYNGDAVRGEGIFKTTDAGASWTRLSATNNTDFHYVNKLEYDPTTSTLWAATRSGLHKSTNGGTSFTKIIAVSNCMDIEIALTTPRTIYASFGHFAQSELRRSTDAGANWSSIFTQSGIGRLEIAVSRSTPNTVYFSGHKLSDNQCGVFKKSTNSGTNWTDVTIPGPAFSGASTYTSGQAWYNNILAVDPNNVNILYAAGLDAWKTTNGGSTWTQISNWYTSAGAPPYMHADIHAIAFHPTNSAILFTGNDGGVYKSTNSGSTWTSLNNGLNITQFYYGAIHPTAATFVGGTQDNGTIASQGTAQWIEIIGGDGGACEIDYNNPNIGYGEYVNFCFLKTTDGGNSFNKSMNGIPVGSGFWDGTTDRTLFISPFVMDPNNPQILIGGTYRVWRTTNSASSWTAASGDLTGDGTGSNGAKISALAIAKGNSAVMYVGTTNGRVQVTTNTGSTWNLRNSGLPSAYITKVAIDPGNSNIAYATFSGFASGQKVYKTTNAGVSWTNISSNFPNLPVNSFAINPANTSNLYAGTDLGVFSTTDGGTTWTRDGSAMPNVVVSDLKIRASDSKIVAFTHGRGAWAATLPGGGAQTTSLVYDNGVVFSGYNWPNNGQGSANRMTSPVANAKLTEISYYITGVTAGTATFKPIVKSKAGNGAPGSDLVNYTQVTANTVPGWNTWNTSAQNILVTGDFFIGIIYDGVNRPGFGYNQTNNGRAWDFDGNAWSAWNETYFMRATVQTTTAIIEFDNSTPTAFNLFQNYPNPFNPTTVIKFALPASENVTLTVYDITGKKVAELVNGQHQAGSYSYEWNGKNDFGQSVSSGVYLCTIKAGNQVQTIKMLLQK
ncbi:MAG: hypothetical protein HBSAPP04_10310 [Ignavibacteriaceae bacterium]|nr:MAG: hypothetical protein HBSAPP04_10310 [Ignavibacteriaceae bacterium]